MERTETPPVMERITAAVERSRRGDVEAAAAEFDALWAELAGPAGDPFHRCVLAHYAADVQPDPHAELMWDRRALAAAAEATDASAQAHHPSLRIAGFYPSLHLNLADVLRRLGDAAGARDHVAAARARMGDLPDDEATAGYAETIRTALDRVERDLDAAG
ncbi:hypothetical protein [Pseudonocardia dioxanivorans]|jgi:hypothetical protein|uniref:hypothetical protein n=1 Tax=Pseudonocardia dioxanivorans TaxID=240495 RepID=UPI001F2D4B03|nr:hypothetical protein [Pseudonocardia dioxanivorans]